MSDLESMSMEVDMILADQSGATEPNRNYATFQLSFDCAKNQLLIDEDQRATYYLGGICCLMPEVTNNIIEAVRSTGRGVRTICFPSAAARNGLIFPPKNVEPEKVMALFGYLVIMIYMNVSVFNFVEFSKKRFKALCNALIFSVGEGEDVAVFSDVYHWFYLQTTYGFNHEIRKAILSGILNLSKDKDSFGSVLCSYLAEILKVHGHDMNLFYNSHTFSFPYYVDVHRNQQSHKSASLLAGNGEEEVEVVFKNLIYRLRSSCSWSSINI